MEALSDILKGGVSAFGGGSAPSWYGKIYGVIGNGDPGVQMAHMQRGGNGAATPTNIFSTVARCSLFTIPVDTTINTIRFYGVGATTSVYKCAIYRYSDLARLTSDLTFTTAAATWGTAGTSLALALTANTLYFIACSVNTTGATAGVGCVGASPGASTGQVATAPDSLPGNLQVDLGYLQNYFFQFTVLGGALPDPASGLSAQGAWTGGMPAFWLDNA